MEQPMISDSKVAAQSASFRQVSRSPFGEEDEIGMVNLMSRDSRREVFSVADGDRVFDLAVDYFMGMPAWTRSGDPPFQIWMSHRPSSTVVEDPMGVGREQNELVGYSGDCLAMYSHCGTHMDVLNHFGYRGEIWNGFNEREHLGSRHWMVCGPENYPPIVARGVLLDIARAHGVEMLPDSYGIGSSDIRAALAHQDIELRTGDVVLIRTGRMHLWPDQAFVENEPGLNREGAEFLAQGGAMIIGADNQALEQMPTEDPENWQVVHTYLFAEAGVPIIEVAYLEEIAAEGLHEFVFIGACLRVRGATAGPMRPLAFPFRDR